MRGRTTGAVRLRATWAVAAATAALSVCAGGAAAAPRDAAKALEAIVLPERAAASFPDSATASCRRDGVGAVRCDVRIATLDGDVVWDGTAALTNAVWTPGAERYRYRVTGTKTLCAPGGSGGCNEREFTWKGRGCGAVNVNFPLGGEGSAVSLHAVRMRCQRARRVARACMHGNGNGRKMARSTGPGRVGLRGRAGATVTWMLAGGGGCDELFG